MRRIFPLVSFIKFDFSLFFEILLAFHPYLSPFSCFPLLSSPIFSPSRQLLCRLYVAFSNFPHFSSISLLISWYICPRFSIYLAVFRNSPHFSSISFPIFSDSFLLFLLPFLSFVSAFSGLPAFNGFIYPHYPLFLKFYSLFIYLFLTFLSFYSKPFFCFLPFLSSNVSFSFSLFIHNIVSARLFPLIFHSPVPADASFSFCVFFAAYAVLIHN